jgi:ATP-dependent RNA helicase DeaD
MLQTKYSGYSPLIHNLKLYLCPSNKKHTLSTFSELGLSQEILKVLPELGIDTPTQIQQQAIPFLIASQQDFIGLAQTGTGKTAAFGLPIIDTVEHDWHATQAIVLAPTRELVQQISDQLKRFSKYHKQLHVVSVYGGASITGQIKDLKKGCQIVVATPGRCLDLIDRKALNLENISHVILDEADEMLNMGFKEELNKILAFTPEDKKTWLFSATMPKAIKNMVHQYMHNPKEIKVSTGVEVNENIAHKYVLLKSTDKTEAIKRIMDSDAGFYGIIFCRTKMDTLSLAEDLNKDGYSVDALNGDLTQKQRDMVMKKFKAMKLRALIATDVAARGIDVNNVTHVIHHRLPDEIEFYTHRSGRTARAGNKGESITLATKGDVKKIKFLEQRLKIDFIKDVVPSASNIRSSKLEQWAHAVAKVKPSAKIAKEDWHTVQEIFFDLDRDALIQKLISMELESLSSSADKDINVEDRERAPSDPNSHRFYINLGEMDGLDETDLLDLIAEVTGIPQDKVTDLTLQNKCSYYTVPKKMSSRIEQNLNGLEINGREVRTNRDDDGKVHGVKKERSSYQRGGNRGKGGKGRRKSSPGGKKAFKGRRRY